MPSHITPSGGTKSTTTPLLIAFCPSLEVASAELRHMAQPWLRAGTAHSRNTAVRSVARILISLPTTVYGRRLEKRRSSLGSGKPRPSTWSATSSAILRSEEHTSELQSLAYLVCRLLLEKKKKIHNN